MSLNYKNILFNVHLKAHSDQKTMIEILKSSENWVEGTLIHHDTENLKGNVQFYFDFPPTGDVIKDSNWESEIKSVISQFPKG